MEIILFTIFTSFCKSYNSEPIDISQECANDYRCVIKNLIFHIPNLKTFQNNMHVMLTGIIIYGIDINSLTVTENPDQSMNKDQLILNLQINEVKLNATVNSLVYISAQIFNFTLTLPVQFFRKSDQLIENLTIIKEPFFCKLESFEIKFKGIFSSAAKKYTELINNTINNLINNNTNLYSLLNPLIIEKGSKLFESINGFIHSKINSAEKIKIPIFDSNELIPIVQSPVIDAGRFILNEIISDNSNPLYLNNFINRFVDTSNVLNLSKVADEFDFNLPIVLETPTDIDLIINDISISGLNTWHDLSFLFPNSNSQYILDSRMAVGNIDVNVSAMVNFSSNVSQEINLYAKLVNNQIDLGVQIAAFKDGGLNYTSSQFLNFNCLSKLVNIDECGITNLLLNTTLKKLDYDSNGFLDGFVQKSFDLIQNFFFLNFSHLLPKIVSGYIYESLFMTDLANLIENQTNSKSCEITKDKSFSEMDVKVTYISFCVAAVLGILMILLVIFMTKKINSKDDKSEMTIFRHFFRTDSKASLMMHPAIPFWIRLLVPLLLFSIIALFISMSTGLEAYIFIKFLINDNQIISLPPMFEFSLISFVILLWDRKSYFLSILICLLSCFWPVIKLILMFIVWILPLTILKVHVRTRILNALNELGKWSLLDSYVVIVIIAAFHLKYEIPTYSSKDIPNPTYISLLVYPGYGFITLIIGTLLSLAMSNVICYVNRKALNFDEIKKTTDSKKSLFKKQNLSLNIFYIILLIVTLATYSYGICTKSGSVTSTGYVGWIIEVFQMETSQSFSVVELGVEISKSAHLPNSFIIRITQLIFFILTILLPYIHIICLFVLLFLPMSKKNLKKFFYICKIIYSWSCMDVFIIGFFVAMFVITHIYVKKRKCGFLRFVVDMSYLENNSKCYSLSIKFRLGAYLILVAAICYTIMKFYFEIKIKKLVKEEEEVENDINETETEENNEDDITENGLL